MMFGFKYSIGELKRSESIAPQSVIEFSQLRSLIKGMFPYVIEVKQGFEDKKLIPYIHTHQKSLEFISKSPIYLKQIAIAKLACEEEQLVYYEKALYSKESNYLAPTLKGTLPKKVFFKKLETCNFNYQFAHIRNTPSLITLHIKPYHKKSLQYHFAPMVDFNNTRLILIANTKDI
jgi:hypothetical protein